MDCTNGWFVQSRPVVGWTILAVLLLTPWISSAQSVVTNGNFESGFEDGLALGWTAFTERGTVFRENSPLGALGGGVYGASHGEEDEINISLNGKCYVVDSARLDVITQLQKALGPTVITIAKLNPDYFFEGEQLISDPYQKGERFADHCYNESEDRDVRAHAYYGLNEPDVNSTIGLRDACRFELGFTRRLHELGMRSVVLNHSVGTPANPGHMVLPEMRELLAEADYVGYHAFGSLEPVANGGQLLCGTASLEHFSLRWRKYAEEYLRRGWRFPPVIYTQGGTWGGWRENPDLAPRDVAADYICFSEHMSTDLWAVGMCVFVTGAWTGQTWKKWDITEHPEVVRALSVDNWQHPVDAFNGQGSQQITGTSGVFDGGIVQAIQTEPGAWQVRGYMKWEFSQGWPGQGEFRLGWDPTGQTRDMDAATVQWSEDLIRRNNWDTDIWYGFEREFEATGNEASLWLRAAGRTFRPWVRVYVDEVTAERL